MNHWSILKATCTALILTLAGGCTLHSDPRVGELNELADSIQTHLRLLDQPSNQQTAEAAEWATNNLREFELLLEGGVIAVTKEEGKIISDVSRSRRLLKDQSQRRNSLPKSGARAVGQLRGLAEAIRSNATTDAAGTAIDSAYLSREVQTELALGRDVVQALLETQQLAERGIAIWQKTAERSDSLQTVCRARLAKAIIDGE